MAHEVVVVDKPQDIRMVCMLAQRGALALEVEGLRRRGRSVYSIVKQSYGFRGSKARVLQQLEDKIEETHTLQSRYTARKPEKQGLVAQDIA